MPITVRYEFSVVIGAILWILGWFSLANVWNIPRINAWSSQSPWPHGSLVFFLANIFWIAGIIICGALGPVTVLNYLTTLKITGKEIQQTRWLGLYKSWHSIDDIVKLERKTTRDNLIVLTITFSDGRKIKADSSGRGFTKFRDYLENYCRDQGREVV